MARPGVQSKCGACRFLPGAMCDECVMARLFPHRDRRAGVGDVVRPELVAVGRQAGGLTASRFMGTIRPARG